MFIENFCGEIIDSLSAHIAVLDKDGVIVLTNRAWQKFGASNSLKGSKDSIGQNYLAVSEQAQDEAGHIIAQGIRKVISGDLKEFFTNYPCHSPTEKHWFAMRADFWIACAQHTGALGQQMVTRGQNVINFVTNMVDAASGVLVKKSLNRGCITERV